MADISEIQLSDNTSYDVEDTPARTIIGVTADSENNISKIKLADNTEYNLKDTQARASIETITTDVKNQVNVDKDLINDGVDFIDDETLDEYREKIEEMQDAYKKFIPIQTTSGTEITLDNSNNDKAITSIGLDGNTEQFTTTGKNLFDYTKIGGVGNGTINNGIITSKTNTEIGLINTIVYFSDGAISVPANTTVYFSVDVKLNSGSTGSFNKINDGANNSTSIVAPTTTTSYQRYQSYITYASSKTINQLLLQSANVVGSVDIKNIMISTSSNIDYEQYTNRSLS